MQRIIGEYRAWAEGLRARNQLHARSEPVRRFLRHRLA
jgi:hypothetical protein